MSSKQMTERNRLELLQIDYRRAWHQFTVAVESVQSTTNSASTDDESVKNAHSRVDEAALHYRHARNALADWLLQEDLDREASEDASRSAQSTARCQAA